MPLEPDLAELPAAVAAVSRAPGAPGFCRLSLPAAFDPRHLLHDPLTHDVVASYERPDRGLALVAIGEAARVEVPAGASPSSVRAEAQALLERHDLETVSGAGGDAPGLRPRLLGGFRFNPEAPTGEPWQVFGAGWLTLPQILFVRDGESTGMVLGPGVEPSRAAEVVARVVDAAEPTATVGAGSLRVEQSIHRGRWCASVEQIAGEVRAGVYEKVVLASSMVVSSDGRIPVGRVLDRLRRGYPECFVFGFRSPDGDGAGHDSIFLGASPELLVSLSDGSVHALGLAGSTPRGATAEEDERLGAALLASAKDRIEHETVVRAIREQLEGATEELRAPNQPELRRLRNIQHLATNITGRARPGVHILDLVQRLHPTPAVCGWPSARAREVIAEHEAFDRGWYAGPIGWVDDQGDGEFAVALRSAVVRGDHAWLFAGNGIMGDSDPEAEYAEVQLKFRPLIDALGA